MRELFQGYAPTEDQALHSLMNAWVIHAQLPIYAQAVLFFYPFFYNKIISGKGNDKTVRQKKYAIEKNIVDYAIPRYLVKDEFNKIWDKQAEFYPQMKKENLKKEIYDILFYERPAAPYATGKCIYFREEDGDFVGLTYLVTKYIG